MRLGRLTSNSITHIDMHKPNDKLVSAQLQHFGAQMNHGQTRTHKTHHGPNLGEAITFPLILYFVPDHKISTQMSFYPGTPKWSFEILTIRTLATLGAHNFVCKPPIEMRSKAKLQASKAFQRYVTRHLHVRKSRRFLTFSGSESNYQFDSWPFFWP